MATQEIKDLDSLIKTLEYGTGYGGFGNLLQNIKLIPQHYEHLLSFDPTHYTRQLLHRNDSVEALLMCWLPGQESAIHNYDDQEGWILVLEGELEVDNYMKSSVDENMEKYRTNMLKKGDWIYVNDYIGYHGVANRSDKNAVSLHIHAGPVLEWNIFKPKTKSYERMKLTLDK